MAITLGPILFNWPAQKKIDFYQEVANNENIKTVYLGEVVCQKRFACWGNVYDDIVTMLKKANKEVIISSLALINNEKELEVIDKYAQDKDVLIEVNDVAAIANLEERFCIGPYVNVYNEDAFNFYAKTNAKHITLIPELPLSSIEAFKHFSLEKEVTCFGRLPLAISARCAHARIYKQTKSNCKYVCDKDLDGLNVSTLDDESFLTINGLQTMSSSYVNLIKDMDNLKKAGVTRFRISPHHNIDIHKVFDIFTNVDKGAISSLEGYEQIVKLNPDINYSNGFLYQKPGYAYQVSGQEKD
jgi:collagenase-like PrtC family protease